uniref:hypothetical protein n=1 Tax=Pedobacter schmidteae TaxID=2201271 RepID=UPI000EAC9CF1|nr:hypothetical protein [Pedobacter schmidteae]
MKQERKRAQFFKLLLIGVLWCWGMRGSAQTKPVFLSQAKAIVTFMDTLRKKMPVEKLYLHLDKCNYTTQDTIWFKVYALQGPYLEASEKSGICYVELVNDRNQVTKRIKIPLRYGLGWANISLADMDLSSGVYAFRAYTNWMRNFAEQSAYTANIFISNLVAGDIAVKEKNAIKKNGTSAYSGRQKSAAKIPVGSDSTDLDLQFMPESGRLLAGINGRVGFKALGKNGKGVGIEGKVFDDKKREICSFKSIYKGIGDFELNPEKGVVYHAAVVLPGGQVKNYPLPVVYEDGTALKISNEPEHTDVSVTIVAGGKAKSTEGYFLVGQARGVVCYAVPVNLTAGTAKETISKKIFPTGITRFTLLSRDGTALNERMIYIDHKDQLNVTVQTTGAKHYFRDSIALNLKVTNKDNEPVQGSFSLAVTDDGQVLGDFTGKANMMTRVFLTADLKGEIEGPGFYADTGLNSSRALDNLLLTQGWTGYDWKDVFDPKPAKYPAETEFVITGKVSSVFSGIAAARVNLIGQKPFVIRDTVAASDGRFIFKNLPLSDSASYKLQAYNKKGKGFLVNLEVDEWQPPVFGALPIAEKEEDQDSVLLAKVKTATELSAKSDKISGRLLQEVNISAKKIVKKSYNLNGPGEADQVMTEKDLQKEGKKSLYDLLFQYVTNLKTGSYLFPPSPVRKYGMIINGKVVKIVMDGVDLDQTYHYYQPLDPTDAANEGMRERYLYLIECLDHFKAEDITGIEVMHSPRYNAGYNSQFLSTAETMFSKNGVATGIGGVSGVDYAYIEITTRGGKGPFIKQSSGAYLLKPLVFTLPKQFYSPRYRSNAADKSILDIRSTIHWVPNLVTNEKGEVTVSFYAADQAASYTIVMEGTDMNGQLGSLTLPAYLKIGP